MKDMVNKVSNQSLLNRNFPILSSVLDFDQSLGVQFSSKFVNIEDNKLDCPLPTLKYYYANSVTEKIIKNNISWAIGNSDKPIFQFAYLMLPTSCNQACGGCFMGQDKGKLPAHLVGPEFGEMEIKEIIRFLKNHGAQSIVYGGIGELFTWDTSFEFIQNVIDAGLGMVIFTNGTLLSKDKINRLNELGVTIIFSIRDTIELYHNSNVRSNSFIHTLFSIEYALEVGMHHDNRLAVEIPVTNENEERIIDNFIPAMMSLNIVPMVEEYIQISTDESERAISHNFKQSRIFFRKIDERFFPTRNQLKAEFGSRMVGQPQCKRPLYSFAIFPNRDVMDCPSHSVCYGNLKNNSLEEIIYSDNFKQSILDFQVCACSAFFTKNDSEIPKQLPNYLEVLR